MNKVTIKVKHFFEGVYMYTALLMVMLGVIFLLYDLVVAFLFFFLSLLVFSTVYKLAVFKDEGFYKNYLWFMGIKKGSKVKFKSIDGLMIVQIKHAHHLSKNNPDAVLEYTLFRGYIIFDGHKKVLIGQSKNQAKIEKKISKLRDELGVNVIDAPKENT